MTAIAEAGFERFLRYDELTDVLTATADAHPDLVELTSIGRSYEGRDIWLVTVTDAATGPAADKPALWLEANIHSIELTGSLAALHLIDTVVEGHRTDERLSRLLASRTLYVVPRLNPDGAEAALADVPTFTRSSVRPWHPPFPPGLGDRRGLEEADVDADGRILDMRVEDPNGVWKADAEDPRLLVPRGPDEDGPGPYFRLLTEGRLVDPDGRPPLTIPAERPEASLDLNRNWPMEWAPESQQYGAGPYPTSEPEIRAAVAAIAARPNVFAYIAYHTHGGVHLRPYSTHDDQHFPTPDLRRYRDLGDRLTAITGYRNVSVYHDFKYDLKVTEHGASDDWAYDHLGLMAWTWELWSIQRAAGIEDGFHLIEWYNDHPVEDDRKLLAWADEHAPDTGFVPWYPFDHPQLGRVELGGWDPIAAWANPPARLREAEAAKVTEASIFHALVSPLLAVRETRVEPAGPDTWRVRVVAENRGWLPTQVTEKALERRAVTPVVAEATLPAGAALAGGRGRVELGQLAGRALKRNMTAWADDTTSDRAVAEWVIVAAEGTEIEVTLSHPRAGTVRTTLTLGGVAGTPRPVE